MYDCMSARMHIYEHAHTHTHVHICIGRSVVGRGTAGPSNKNSVGWESSVAAFLAAVAAAMKDAKLGDEASISCFVLSMSGVDCEADAIFWQNVCSEHFPASRAVVENDSVAALCSGTDGVLCGIVVISGTGSIGVGAASATAPKLRVGGMGPLLGDGGNGYSIGLAALGAAVKASDGRGRATPLLAMILDKYSLQHVDGLLGLAYGEKARLNSWDEVAALAPLVFKVRAYLLVCVLCVSCVCLCVCMRMCLCVSCVCESKKRNFLYVMCVHACVYVLL